MPFGTIFSLLISRWFFYVFSHGLRWFVCGFLEWSIVVVSKQSESMFNVFGSYQTLTVVVIPRVRTMIPQKQQVLIKLETLAFWHRFWFTFGEDPFANESPKTWFSHRFWHPFWVIVLRISVFSVCQFCIPKSSAGRTEPDGETGGRFSPTV